MGRTVVAVRRMSVAELESEAWDVTTWNEPPAVIVFDDGSKIYPARDYEGNGPGVLFGTDASGEHVVIGSKAANLDVPVDS